MNLALAFADGFSKMFLRSGSLPDLPGNCCALARYEINPDVVGHFGCFWRLFFRSLAQRARSSQEQSRDNQRLPERPGGPQDKPGAPPGLAPTAVNDGIGRWVSGWVSGRWWVPGHLQALPQSLQ